jgi:hypothetical protein
MGKGERGKRLLHSSFEPSRFLCLVGNLQEALQNAQSLLSLDYFACNQFFFSAALISPLKTSGGSLGERMAKKKDNILFRDNTTKLLGTC